jgi:hypothetical protein
MPDPYTDFYAAFLKDHPEELAGVRMVPLEGESTLMMTAATLRRFISWALGMGLVQDEDKALLYLTHMDELEAKARAAHKHDLQP